MLSIVSFFQSGTALYSCRRSNNRRLEDRWIQREDRSVLSKDSPISNLPKILGPPVEHGAFDEHNDTKVLGPFLQLVKGRLQHPIDTFVWRPAFKKQCGQAVGPYTDPYADNHAFHCSSCL